MKHEPDLPLSAEFSSFKKSSRRRSLNSGTVAVAVPSLVPLLEGRLVAPTAAIANAISPTAVAPTLQRLCARRLRARRRAQSEQRAPQRLRRRRGRRRWRCKKAARREKPSQEVEAGGQLVEEGERVYVLATRRRLGAPPLHTRALPAPTPEAADAATIDQALCRQVSRGPAAAVVGGGGAVGENPLLERPTRAAAEEATEVVALPAREERFGSDALVLANRLKEYFCLGCWGRRGGLELIRQTMFFL
jgi:hypothetical protein